jgi:HAD superfamily 5'-nucleotidase-like hydrolase
MSDKTDPLEEATELLELVGISIGIADAYQVYVNRDLRMSKIKWVGFDMDYTLALYRQAALDELSVRHSVDTLVDDLGYPNSVRKIKSDPEYAIRGLVVDKSLGNILKMDSHYYVGKAYHGTRALTRDERQLYQDEPVKIELKRYRLIDTLFGLPEAFLYGAVIDQLESDRPGSDLDYAKIYDDVRSAIDLAHADGRIKREMLTNLDKFVYRDPDLATTLHKFRSAGKRLFLLTNSEWYYTTEVMAYLLDGDSSTYPSWRHYFDVAITTAQKPAFFQKRNPFIRLDGEGKPDGTEKERFERIRIYEGGNVDDFERMLGIRGTEVLYVGDHIYGDVIRSKRDSAWRTVMIIQEMEAELKERRVMREQIGRWGDLDQQLVALNSDLSARRQLNERLEQIYDGPGAAEVSVRSKLDRVKRELNQSIDKASQARREVINHLINLDDEIAANFNRYWGLLFKEGGEHSIFGSQVEAYACLYTSKVSNLRRYSPMQYFRALRQVMPHEI